MKHHTTLPSGGGNHRLYLAVIVVLSCIAGLVAVYAQPLPLHAEAETEVPGTPGSATASTVVNFSELVAQEEAEPLADLPQEDTPFLPDPAAEPPAEEPGAPALAATPPVLTTNLASPLAAESFPGLADTGRSAPPDTNGAVGPDHIMTTLVSQVRIQSRANLGISQTLSLNRFWSRQLGDNNVFDPHILYDPYANRWLFTVAANRVMTDSAVLIGVSQTSVPTGMWNLYKIDVDSNDTTWFDAPTLGFNNKWVVVSGNRYFITSTNTLVGAAIYTFDKADLYAGVAANNLTFTVFNPAAGFSMVPAATYDHTVNTMYLLESRPNDGPRSLLRLSSITGPVGGEVLNFGEKAYYRDDDYWEWSNTGGRNFAPQLGSAIGITTNDSRMQNVVYRNGSLWATHTVFLPRGAVNRSAVQWWQLNPAIPGPFIVPIQLGRIDDANQPGGKFYAFPSIAVNEQSDVLIGFSRFGANQYASANYAFRDADDPVDTLRLNAVLKAGEDPYVRLIGSGASASNRWGDYSATVVDPRNDLDMWTLQEYAATSDVRPTNTAGRWGTWWGRIDRSRRVRFDFDGDGKSDILWRNTANGTNRLWFMDDLAATPADLSPVSTAWKVVGTGDFNGDHKSDILWRQTNTGANTIWFMNGTGRRVRSIASVSPENWRVAGIGDFDDSGTSDILWRNMADGRNTIWFMNGTRYRARAIATVSLSWDVVGIGDFNRNGTSDILWRNTTTGRNTIWLMLDHRHTSRGLDQIADQNWKVAGTGDTNADGNDDILWRHIGNGSNTLWLMNSTTYISATLPRVTVPDWKVVAVGGDYNGDERGDILWRNIAIGRNVIWRMNGARQSGGAITPWADSNWKVVGTSSYAYDSSGHVGPAAILDIPPAQGDAPADPAAAETLLDGPPGTPLIAISDDEPLLGDPPGDPLLGEPVVEDGNQLFLPLLAR